MREYFLNKYFAYVFIVFMLTMTSCTESSQQFKGGMVQGIKDEVTSDSSTNDKRSEEEGEEVVVLSQSLLGAEGGAQSSSDTLDNEDEIDGPLQTAEVATNWWSCCCRAAHAAATNASRSLRNHEAALAEDRNYPSATAAAVAVGVANLVVCGTGCCVSTAEQVQDILEEEIEKEEATAVDSVVTTQPTQGKEKRKSPLTRQDAVSE